MSEYSLPELPNAEGEFMSDERFRLGWRCGMIMQTAVFMRDALLQGTDAACARTFMPVEVAPVIMRIKDLTHVVIHSADVDENVMVVCIHRPGVDFHDPV